jgi:hypothetical protein
VPAEAESSGRSVPGRHQCHQHDCEYRDRGSPDCKHPDCLHRDWEHRVLRIVPDGPILIEGPVDLLHDGGVVRSDRFMVAVCTCRRSHTYPLCDTSHRQRIRKQRDAGS